MNYFKSYKKNKKNNFINWIFIIVIVLFVNFFFTNKIKSDNNDKDYINAEENINKASKNIVGIIKNYDVVNDKGTFWGSGVVVSKEGYILTNEHVIGNQINNIYVTISQNEKLKANVIWSNKDIDLAIIKINYKFSDCAILGDSDKLNIGERVFSIGNPIGVDFKQSVNCGIISGINRNLEFEEDGEKFFLNNLIQTDAVINQGNSGGALINQIGQVIGITTIKITSAEAMGFAIPINLIKPVINKIENTGKFEEATLNIWGYDKYSINKTNLKINLENGIYIGKIGLNSNIEKAGIKIGDIIISIDEREVDKINDLKSAIYEKNIGNSVKLKIKRAKREFYVDIILEKNKFL